MINNKLIKNEVKWILIRKPYNIRGFKEYKKEIEFYKTPSKKELKFVSIQLHNDEDIPGFGEMSVTNIDNVYNFILYCDSSD